MTTETKKFHLANILSITTGMLCPHPNNKDYPMRTVREILKFMVGEDTYTFALGRVADECKPYLLEAYPQLAAITSSDMEINGEFSQARFNELVAKYGAWFEVRPIHPEDHQQIDPQVELAMIAPHIECFQIDLDESDEE